MLKFVKHHLDTITGVGVYPVISFLLFFTFFLLVLLWLRNVRQGHITHMAALPLSDNPTGNETRPHAD